MARQIYLTPTRLVSGTKTIARGAFPAGELMLTRTFGGRLYILGGYVTTARYANEFRRVMFVATVVSYEWTRPFGVTCLVLTPKEQTLTHGQRRFLEFLVNIWAKHRVDLQYACPA